MLPKCQLWDEDSSHPITHSDGFILLDQWLWGLLEQHCTMIPHLKAQIRWLVTCRSRSQNFKHARASSDQSACDSALELEESAITPAQRKGLMETRRCRDYWSRNTKVSKTLPLSKSNITIWNLRLNTCAAYWENFRFWELGNTVGNGSFDEDSIHFSVAKDIITADRSFLAGSQKCVAFKMVLDPTKAFLVSSLNS